MFVNSIQQSTAIDLLKAGSGKLKATEKRNIVQESQNHKWTMMALCPHHLSPNSRAFSTDTQNSKRRIFQESSSTEEQQLKPKVNMQKQPTQQSPV